MDVREMAGIDPRDEFKRELRRHPRLLQQKLVSEPEAIDALAGRLPKLVPFRGNAYAGALWILDWDHRLPSRDLVLRLLAFYTPEERERCLRAFEERRTQIARDDLFPEFDVPDFAGLPADEAYEAELTLTGEVKKVRLVSEWRREVGAPVGRRAEEVVRNSPAYKELSSQVRARPPGLGDLEAAEWAPPSESGHGRWGLDVWYLRSFNGMVGEGTAFLVDLEEERVVSQRDFQFRAG
jgi:hypothetical protein